MPFVLYGGNKFPVYSEKTIDENGQIHYEGEIKAFDKLSGDAELKKLAILRMDVDGLGAVFSDQVDGSAYLTNWARYATLSKSLDLFFKGYLNVIQEEVELSLGLKDSSVIIYSGGDDLFIVGRWDTVLEMSQNISKRFSIWSNGNLTLSGGIELLPAKFPIMQAARMTANAEEKAKEHICGIQKKNAICFLGTALNWDLEFSIVKELHDEIFPLLSAKKISKSFLSKIDGHATRQDHYLENNDKVAPKWRWLMAYDMSRYVASIKDEEVKKILNKYVTYSFTDSYKNGPLSALKTKYSFLKLLQIACRWVELKYRTNNIE
jgi:CRISPR-associated protein Csm1